MPTPEPSPSGVPGAGSAPSTPSAVHLLAVVLAGFAAFLGLYAPQPLLPLLSQVFHAGKVAVSLTLTACTIGVALSAPVIGSLADRLGRKRLIVWCSGLLAFATLLSATAASLPMLVFWRFLQGVFTPGVFAVTVAYIQEEWTGGGAGRATAFYVAGAVVGGFCGRMTCGFVASHANWHWSFVALGAMGFVATAVLAAGLPRERQFRQRRAGTSTVAAALSHLRNPRLVATFGAGACVLFSLLATFTYVNFYLAAPPFGLGPAGLAAVFFVYLVGAFVTPPCGRAIDRYGQRAAFAVAMAVAVAGVLLTLVPSLGFVVAGLALCCSGVFVAQASANNYLGVAAEHDRALAIGLYSTFYYAGGSAGAALPGYLWALGGWPACVALVACVQVVTMTVALLAWKAPAAGGRGLERDTRDCKEPNGHLG